LPLLLVVLGVFTAWLFYMKLTDVPAKIATKLNAVYSLLMNKYYFDDFNQKVFAEGAVSLGAGLTRWGDKGLIDGVLVNGSANSVARIASWLRGIQTGYLYHYAFAMLVGLLGFFGWIFLA